MIRADPEVAFMVLMQREDFVAGEAVFSGEGVELRAIESIEADLGANPQVSLPVFINDTGKVI